MPVTLARILVYPIKSLDGISVAQATVLSRGALEHDRRFALFDPQGRIVNGKRTPRMHRIRSEFDLASGTVTLGRQGETQRETFPLGNDPRLEAWLSDALGEPVRLRENTCGGFPDDEEAPGPTVISVATLREVGGWFGEPLDATRRRFRANLELEADEPFWEDRLAGAEVAAVRFRIGAVELLGTNPCQRCAVPPRDPDTGDAAPRFQAEFARRRESTLPAWAPRERFDHFYRLAVNTRAAGSGGAIRVGDPLTIASLL